MPERPRLELATAALALLVAGAFLVSFAVGLGDGSSVTADIEPDAPVTEAPPLAGRLEVLNASGRGGLARAATFQLREAGFDVVFFGNAPASVGDSSAVISRTGEESIARAAGAELGIRRITSDPDSTLLLDATVIVGVDWAPAEEVRPPDPDGWRARLRRWLGRSR
ncbi:MAG TPA: LytR C-terminal domain-containing protein [Longimicrobiales bacterium]